MVFLQLTEPKAFIKEDDVVLFEGGENPLLTAKPQGQAAELIAGKISERDLLMLDKDEVDELELVDGYGFPDENGVLLIDDEVILYRRKEGNKFYELRRGSSAVTVLPSYRDEGKYLSKTEPASHYQGSVVYNLSVLSLMAILDSIHNTYSHNITRDRVVPEVNRATILKHIKDFFRSKGSKLGIKALFKILFAENDVDVFYPGDRMITPSKSTWAEGLIVRTVPVPVTFCNRDENYTTPDKTIGSALTFKSYSATITNEEGNQQTFMPEDEFARSYVDYAVSYEVESETQYEMFVNEDALQGRIITNPRSILTRELKGPSEGVDDRSDYYIITVESTLGFPNKGVVFIDNEAIFYEERTPNQFLYCKRGYIGVEATHRQGSYVYGPYYIETRIVDKDDVEYVSRSWPVGLVESVDIKDPGLLHTIDDNIYALEPGRIDPADPLLCRLDYSKTSRIAEDVDFTFLENYNDELVKQATNNKERVAYVEDRTHGPDGIFYDEDYAFISSSGFPSYPIGPFNTTSAPVDQFVGPLLAPDHYLGVVPRRPHIMDNPYTSKGSDLIGTFVDGVRAYSQMSPEKVIQGRIARIDVGDRGEGYINPTVVITPGDSTAEAIVAENTGSIQSIEVTSDSNFTATPRVRISSGEGAVIIPSMDRYGRIKSVSIRDQGRYYYDVPTISATDQSGKGKGALFSCTVIDGQITKVEILNHGIDYDQASTEIIVTPIGSGATASAVVEYYDINRYVEVISNPYWTFDDGNGFIYRRPLGEERRYFGYVCSPTKLREQLNDDGSQHSPILGFAYDGNPIYGPYGFVNGEDYSQGVERQISAYILRQSRNGIIAGGANKIGSDPPSTADYPMGYFIQDYVYAPDVIDDILNPGQPPDGFLATEEPKYIHTDIEQFIRVEDGSGVDADEFIFDERILDRNNGKVCNTPDYPKELYPEGVYCYFITVDESGEPAFPYIIGETFNNRPISQRIQDKSQVTISPLPRQQVYSSQIVDGVDLVFDFNRVERLRNPYLESTNKEIQLKIGEVSEGSIDEVHVQIPLPAVSAVGDYLYFDNSGTSGGGAQAVISYIRGVEIAYAEGSKIGSFVNSHHLVLTGLDPTPTLSETSRFRCGDTLNKVIRYNESDQTIGRVIVQTVTKDIPETDDPAYDARNNLFNIGGVEILPETKTQEVLWVENAKDFKYGDKVKIETGYEYPLLDTHELAVIDEIYPSGRIGVLRTEEARVIPDKTPINVADRFRFTVVCVEKHMLQVGDSVKFSGSKYDEINGNHTVKEIDESGKIFTIYTNELYEQDSPCLTYKTNSKNVLGLPFEVALISPGYNYGSLPRVVGTYHRMIDRAQTKITMQDTGIGSIEVVQGGARYVNPQVFIVDREGRGKDAEAFATVVSGQIVSIIVTDHGEGYLDPVVILLETDGKFICTTNDIGKIKSFRVLNPGRNISADRSLKPELMIDTRVVVLYDKNVVLLPEGDAGILEATEQDEPQYALQIVDDRITSPLDNVLEINEGSVVIKDPNDCGYTIIINGGDYGNEEIPDILDGTNAIGEFDNFFQGNLIREEYNFPIFLKGDIVYQGLPTNVTCIGTVIDYDHPRQIVTLEKVHGFLQEDEYLIDVNDIEVLPQEDVTVCNSYLLDDPDLNQLLTPDGFRLQLSENGCVGGGPEVCKSLLLNDPDMDSLVTGDGDRLLLNEFDCIAPEPIPSYNPKKAKVILEGQADCRIVVNGSAKPEGKFIDDTSKVSEWYAVIQDSYRYQWFSYVIASPIQQVDYETFVKEIIHPAGFIQFADLTIHSSVKTRTLTGERDFISIHVDPCAPLKLLAADGTPILAGTEDGYKFILAKNEYCEDVPDPSTIPVLQLTLGPQSGRVARYDESGNLFVTGSILITGDLVYGTQVITGLQENTVSYDENGNIKVYGDIYVDGDAIIDPTIGIHELGDPVTTDENGNIGVDGDLYVKGDIVVNWDGTDDNIIIDDDDETPLSVITDKITTFTGILLRLNI